MGFGLPCLWRGRFFYGYHQQPYRNPSLYICIVGRILAIDYGLKRCGIAVTDPLQIISSPLQTVRQDQLFAFLETYFKEEDVESLVLGMPYNLDGSLSDMCSEVERLKKRLEKKYPNKTIHLMDERFTSHDAQRIVIQSVKSKKKRRDKGLLDRVSASIILESFMKKQSIL